MAFSQIDKDFGNFNFQQNGALLRRHRNVRSFVNEITSTLDGLDTTLRLSTTLVAAKTVRPYTLRLFLVGLYQRYVFCATISDLSGRPQKQKHGCSDFIGPRHSEGYLEQVLIIVLILFVQQVEGT